jgi:hypothetical protein
MDTHIRPQVMQAFGNDHVCATLSPSGAAFPYSLQLRGLYFHYISYATIRSSLTSGLAYGYSVTTQLDLTVQQVLTK